jgi:cytidylate kinase
MADNLEYKNITVSGLPGAGSSTLAKSLSATLNWQYYCGGDFMRKYAIEQGLIDKNNKIHHDATVYNDDFDRQVDYQARKTLLETQHNVLDAWLSGFMAQGISSTLKILVICSNDAIRVDRVVNRDALSVSQAKQHIFEREQKNLTKWQRMYQKEWQEWVLPQYPDLKDKPIYFWYPQMYDLVIDTFKVSPEQSLEIVLSKLNINK